MCGPYIKPSGFLFTDEDGESVTITFDESGSVGSSEIDEEKKIGQDYLDNLVYVMDVSNISDMKWLRDVMNFQEPVQL